MTDIALHITAINDAWTDPKDNLRYRNILLRKIIYAYTNVRGGGGLSLGNVTVDELGMLIRHSLRIQQLEESLLLMMPEHIRQAGHRCFTEISEKIDRETGITAQDRDTFAKIWLEFDAVVSGKIKNKE